MNNSRSDEVFLRSLHPDDAERLADLRRLVASSSEVAMGCSYEEEISRPIERLREQLASPLGVTFGAFSSENLVGAASVLRPSPAPSAGHKATIWGLLVLSSHRRRAIGRRLMSACLSQARKWELRRVNLAVYDGSDAAIQLYLSMGFSQYGREPQALFVRGIFHDALLMSLAVNGAADLHKKGPLTLTPEQ